jgi:hypothetical protein
MISKALTLILTQINQYIQPLAGADEVVLGNIALNELPDQNDIRDKVVISLVNIEEESTLKNGKNYVKFPGNVQYHNRPVFLNLYLLFSAHYPNSYDTSLSRLSSVIRFFQHRNSFDINSAVPIPDVLDPSNPEDADMYLTMELYTMTFEQINHLWGSLGGKQMPFVMYKTRLVQLAQPHISGEGPLIQEIVNNVKSSPENC